MTIGREPKFTVPVIAILIALAGCLVGCGISFYAGNPDVTEAGTAKGVAQDGTLIAPTDTFPPDTERVCLYFRLVDGPAQVILRWYHDDKLVDESNRSYQPAVHYHYLVPTPPTKKYLSAGEYKTEIIIYDKVRHVVRFRVQSQDD